MYRYIGNKSKLTPYILEKVEQLIGKTGTVADIMAGTGTVALELRKAGYSVVASDVMTYSYHHLIVSLCLDSAPSFVGLVNQGIINPNEKDSYVAALAFLNDIEPKEGFFFKEFSPGGMPQNGCEPRKYFTTENAKKIDAVREKINEWIDNGSVSKVEESLLKHTLIMAVNEVANISGTYGYFLADFKKNANTQIELKPVEFYSKNLTGHMVKLGFAENLAATITADLCYIDPPYMKRQYAANYHILETIARGDFPDAVGKSGLRDWWEQHSKLCTKTRGLQSFEKILGDMHCPKFLISYSEDGLFSLKQLEECFSKFGDVKVQEIDYNRFRSNDSKLPKKLKEYLISIERQV
ncbi:adenine-specific DNA-methyltransferase [Enterococcus sp. PF1-24]|uniref:DNA adenine methylase n=1 Tax=unclassified Enterococcus TaxID=2608891 RepID=UPI00247329C4|nr:MULTISPECIES: DNA adenine methylase [unclassified Enterococcus]MDH6363132.1 adenine-specific DNA-methyltransferase [Enterococcus sp. PFB1-1]MDH6400226.1 adenine-specific DNA-methyltransferase [Enterococcus sp. PF1-24]